MPTIDGLGITGDHDEACGVEASGTLGLVVSRVQVRRVLHAVQLVKRNRNVIVTDCHLYENRGVGLYLDDVDLHQINVAGCHISYNAGGGVVSRGGLFSGSAGGKLVALDMATGTVGWESNVATPKGATELERIADVTSRPVVQEKRACAAAYQGRVACFDRRNGSPLWARDTSSNSGLAMDERNVYVTDDKDAITAYDKASGRAGWRQDKLARRQVSAPLVFGDWVVVADGEGVVHVLSADDGSFVARAKVDSAVRTAPVDIGPGFAVQTVKGTVAAFRIK
jgi:outer membrane protein assembly factor BamB